MSKARITYRFEHTRRPPAGQASGHGGEPEAGAVQGTEQAAGQGTEPGKERVEAVGRSASPESNVIPLKHFEFQVSEEPVLLEEKETPRLSPPRRVEPEYPYDYGAWNDASSAEADELERLIRESEPPSPPLRAIDGGRRSAGSRRAAPPPRPYAPEVDEAEADDADAEAGYWRGELPARGDRPRTDRAGRAVPHRRGPDDGPAWWKVAGAVVGAVATGVLFGTFVLQFFTGEPERSGLDGLLDAAAGAVSAPAAESGTPSAEQPGSAAVEGEEADAVEAATATIDLPERRMWLLQNGVFETLTSARALADDMKSKGLAATIEEGDRFYVYAGVTSDRDAALRAGVKLQSAGVEVYVKPYELPAVSQVRWADGSADALAGYVTRGSELVRMIGDLTLVHLEGDAAVAPERATLEKLKTDHRAVSELSSTAAEGLPSEARPMLDRMDGALLNAVVAIEEYATHPDHAYLWSAQSALMDYLIAEKQLLTTIATM
ncbi:SPOR domain-containing protein [Paenibacillus sp.]|uniref:SPOR domain-containing protein n=1 Tax=Paenibacillus sp. TaxID=58172 RepID=UPI002D3E27DE|nr:SPOR domain-containing protein [Paenibacillus sp.]HZG87056.1 SPOR domain-containing protein [Paenibacillus sp.]